MATIDHRIETQFVDRDPNPLLDPERSFSLDQRNVDGEGSRLVDVVLTGGAPWGFTLRGGREHHEPLLITKWLVEEGSKAAGVRLQAGDELVNINDVPLSGYRQEAICLVKGSHKTLTLVVKRRNEPVSRPHSWHSTKFNESQSETCKTQSTPSPVWQPRYDASTSSTDLSAGWDQTNLRRVSDQFSSLGSMDSLEHAPHPYPPGRLSPGKSNNNSVEHLGGGKRDSAYSSFSTSSGTPDYTLTNSNTTSTENMLYKVSQWDSSGRHSNGRHSVGGEGGRQDERPGYLQLPSGTGGGSEEQAGSRHSSSSRTNFGPVWHVPDKRKTSAPSPPPPPPPTRSDSFAIAKVHEKGLVIAYPEGPGAHAQLKSQGKGLDYQGSERGSEARRSFNLSNKNDVASPYISGEGYSQPQLNPSKAFSSTDVRVGLPPYSHAPYHQRQYSDESTFHAQARAVAAPRAQNISGYYCSMQELPTNNHSHFYSQGNQARTPSTSLSTNAIDQNVGDSGGHTRYYCVTTRQPPQTVSQASITKVEDWKARSSSSPEVPQVGGERNSFSAQGVNKTKYLPPQVLPYIPNNRDSNGQNSQGENLYSSSNPTNAPEVSKAALSVEQRASQRRNSGPASEPHYMSYPPSKQTEQRRTSGPPPAKEPTQELWQGQAKICPQKTPMLHSLAKESPEQDDVVGAAGSGVEGGKEVVEYVNGKQVRRSDRYATTLRNEIQMKRAQLQKSRSAAALSSTEEAEEMLDNSPTSGDGTFTISYKDHLKEAQARVLKATSFRRRDLEPILLEHPEPQLPGGPTTGAINRKDGGSLPSVSEVPQTKPASAGGQVSRIGGRKRIPVDKKVRSFSEPDKINEVGVDEDHCPPDNAASLVDRRKFFEATGKPAFPKPLPKQPQQHASDDRRVTRPGGMPQAGQTEDVTERKRSGTPVEGSYREGQDGLSSAQGPESQRLGTFAEYEATWNIQRKPPESKPSGRYHSADNILDPAVEERSKPACVHERSRSSPSADFYGQNIPARGRKSAEYTQPESKLTELQRSGLRLSDRGHSECRVKEKPVEPNHFPDLPPPPPPPPSLPPPPPPPPVSLENPEPPEWDAPLPPPPSPPPPVLHPDPADPAAPPHLHLPPLPDPHWTRHHLLPRPDRYQPTPLDTAPPPPPPPPVSDCQNFLPPPAIWGGALHRHSPNTHTDTDPALCPRRDLEVPKKKKSVEEEEGKGEEKGEELEPQPKPESEPQTEPALPPPSQPSPDAPPLAKPTMEGQHSPPPPSPSSPSPHFSPQRLTDKPPVSLQDEAPGRMQRLSENSSAVRKVPIKIVHTESDTEKESRQYLHPRSGSSSGAAGGGGTESPQGPLGPGATHLISLASPEQSYSVFCAYSRQQRDQGPEPKTSDAGAPSGASEPKRETHRGPQGEHRPPEDPRHGPHPSSNGVSLVGARSRSVEDEKREELARDIIDKDKSLADILDQSKMRTTMDLMEGLFPQGEQLLEGAHQRRKSAAPKQASPRSSEDRKEEENTMAAAVALATSSTYYSTSAPMAELLIKMKDMQQESEEQDSEEELDHDLANKKHELIDSLSRKLQVLREARESLQEDVEDNNALGQEVEATVQQVCKPNELDKFRMFVGDLDKVVSLLLSLSGRLARVENALNSLEEDAPPEERRILTDKRKLLIRQHEDAKELKENLDRREHLVYDILASYLDEESLADYVHFVKMKSALIIEQRKLEDKIKLGDEQLKCLTDSLPLDQRLPLRGDI
ncbi:hypothetical protein ACEWY4_014191 [Coilia grayii]|uniref:Protein Shroom2 n=1 Tax=Coilia grayii TaxID=363190 RepID=A0ABD1JRK6_9TELE